MNYVKKEIKQGINLHLINTDKFKTNLVAVFLTLLGYKDKKTFKKT